MTLYAGSTQSHIALSLGLTSPAGRVAFGTVAGLLLLAHPAAGDPGVRRRPDRAGAGAAV